MIPHTKKPWRIWLTKIFPAKNSLSDGWLMAGLLLFLLANPAQAIELSLITSDSNPIYTNPEGTGLVDRLAQAVFARLGWQVKIGHLPAERALINANEGLDDGELMRVADPIIIKNYPNLVMIPELWTTKEFIAFTNKPQFEIKKWDDLQPYTVAFIKGWRMFEENTHTFPFIIKVTDEEQLFRLISNDRAEVILFDRLQGNYYLHKNGIKGVRVVEPPLAVKNLHLYLNKKYAHLVEPITKTLQEMKADGSHQHILEQCLRDILK